MSKNPYLHGMEYTLSVISGKWKIVILSYLLDNGTGGSSELFKHIKYTSYKTLTTQLRELEQCKLIIRTVYNTKPPKVEYSITEKGLSLKPLLIKMDSWGKEHI